MYCPQASLRSAALLGLLQREAPRADLLNAGAVHGNAPFGVWGGGATGLHESRVDPAVLVRDGSGVGGRGNANARPAPVLHAAAEDSGLPVWVRVRDGVDPPTHRGPRDMGCRGD